MIDVTWYLFVALGALAIAALGAVLIARWPPLVLLITGIYVLIAWDLPVVPPVVKVMGASIYFLDYFAVVLFLGSLPRLWRLRKKAPLFVGCWLTLLAVFGLSLLRGLAENGVTLALNDLRNFLYFAALFQWALTIDWTPGRTRQLIDRGSEFLGWALVAVFVIHVEIRGLGSADQMTIDPRTGDLYSSRPLDSGQALVLTLCAVLCLSNWLQSRRTRHLVASVAFLLCVVLAQNRSSWAAAAGALVVLIAITRSSGRTRLITLVAAGVLAAVLVVASGAIGDVIGKLSHSLSSSGTYNAREDSWHALISQQLGTGDPLRILFGFPMGHGYDRIESSGRLVQYAPHNWYVLINLRAGVVGLIAFITMMGLLLWRAVRHRKATAAAVMTTLLLYGWVYSWNWYEMAFLGWAACKALVLFARNNGSTAPGAGQYSSDDKASIRTPRGLD